jgi:hypothetical protein
MMAAMTSAGLGSFVFVLSCVGVLAGRNDLAFAAKAKAAAPATVMLAPNVGLAQRLGEADKLTLPKALDQPGAVYWGLFKICVDTAGAVERVDVMKSTGQAEPLDQPWMTMMKTWHYKPYLVAGKAVPFCHPLRLQVTSATPAPPPKPVYLPPRVGSQQLLTDLGQSANRPHLPPDLNRDGMTTWALYKTCVTATGEVATVEVQKSASWPRLDDEWMSLVKGWRYRPYTIGGQPVPFCTSVRLQADAEK